MLGVRVKCCYKLPFETSYAGTKATGSIFQAVKSRFSDSIALLMQFSSKIIYVQ